MSEQYQNNDFKNNLQAVKVITSITYEGPAEYSYDKMWIPSATELYINTSYVGEYYRFTKINEGNDNEYYWKNIVGLGHKILVDVDQDYQQYFQPQFDNEDDASSFSGYFLRSVNFDSDGQHGSVPDIYMIASYGDISLTMPTSSEGVRPMCFFA